MLGPLARSMPPRHSHRPRSKQAPKQHSIAPYSSPALVPHDTSASPAAVDQSHDAPSTSHQQRQGNTAMQAADADTQSDNDEEAQLGDADLTQEDHPCTSSPQHVIPGNRSAAGGQCQASSSKQSLHDPGISLSSQPSRHRQPCDREPISPCDQSAAHDTAEPCPGFNPRENNGVDESQAIQIEDESMDDLLEFLADAAAADELQLPAAAGAAKSRSDHVPSSSNQNAGQNQRAAVTDQQQQQPPQPNTSMRYATSSKADALLSNALNSPGISRGADAQAGQQEDCAWVADEKEARMLKAVRAVGLSRTDAAAAHLQPMSGGLPGMSVDLCCSVVCCCCMIVYCLCGFALQSCGLAHWCCGVGWRLLDATPGPCL